MVKALLTHCLYSVLVNNHDNVVKLVNKWKRMASSEVWNKACRVSPLRVYL